MARRSGGRRRCCRLQSHLRNSQIVPPVALAQNASDIASRAPMHSSETDLDLLQQWIGRSETRSDLIHASRADALAATLGQTAAWQAGQPLPPLWHWMYFWDPAPASAIGADGHAARGGFLPPVALPRRMWAGGRLRFERPLPVGVEAKRVSRIADVKAKQGATGALVFVTVEHRIECDGVTCLSEEHDIVYREAPQPGAAASPSRPAPTDARWSRTITPDPVLLFRYSALTFNGHRIHYDRRYVTEVEGYPGLVVHGPLVATLLLELLREALPGQPVARFTFRALGPLFDTETFSVHGRPADAGGSVVLWAANARGEMTMQAEAVLG